MNFVASDSPHPPDGSPSSWIVYLLILLLAFALRAPHLTPLAVMGPDASEYIYCVEHRQLPHSPYIFFLWTGFLLKPFIDLEKGYLIVSMSASLAGIYILGRIAEHLAGSRLAGYAAALALAMQTLSMRFAGIQEVYPFMLFWIALAMAQIVIRKDPFSFGLCFGMALGSHNGSIFALPTCLILFWQHRHAIYGMESRSRKGRPWKSVWAFMERSNQAHGGPPSLSRAIDRGLAAPLCQAPLSAFLWEERLGCLCLPEPRSCREVCGLGAARLWAALRWAWLKAAPILQAAFGMMLPLGLLMVWLLWVWLQGQGFFGLPMLKHFLRGAAPDLALNAAFEKGWFEFWNSQALRTWNGLARTDTIGEYPLVFGGLCLALSGWRRMAPWALLPLLYLTYEMTLGLVLDPGIYAVFILPSLAIGIGLAFSPMRETSFQLLWKLRLMLAIGGLVSLALLLPESLRDAHHRALLPWNRSDGATKALCDHVREHAPADALVIQPGDWHYSGLASALYTDRIPLFRESGEMLVPGIWRPLFNHRDFGHVKTVTTADIHKWLDSGRPILSFDADPFNSWDAYFLKVDKNLFETRLVLWLDQNQSGASSLWRNVEPLASIKVGDATDEALYKLQYSRRHTHANLELPLFHPTLYRVARKTDPTEPPLWASRLQQTVPREQALPPSVITTWCTALKAEEGPISMELPCMPGRDHILRLMIHTLGWDYAIECQAQQENGKWTAVGRDMERIIMQPDFVLNQLYFRVPAIFTRSGRIQLRLLPAYDTPSMNAVKIDWGVDKG